MALIKIPKEMGSTPGIVDNSNATAITIDSSENVGIGVTPTSRLHLKVAGNTYAGGIQIEDADSLTKSAITHINSSLYISAAGTNDDLIIDASGNVGLGTVPTVNNISKSISLVNGGSIFGYGNGTYITANSNYNGAWNTVATGVDSKILLDGNVIFSRSASATAGSAGAVSESMRIDTSGNLLLGTSSVIGGAGGSGAQIFLKQAASSNGVSSVANSNNNYVRMLHTGTAGKVEPTYGTGGSYTPLAFFTGGSEHMRLETAGNLNLLDGNLIFAAGHGVDFSANPHSGQRTSELLDDYEEGTWTPTIFAVGGGTVTGITVGEAYYTKVGRNVNIYFYISSINLAQLTTGTYICLGGLPFTCNGYSDFNFTYMRGGTTIRGGYTQTNSNYIYLCDDTGHESQQASNHLVTHMIGACAYMTNS